jgi:hypothetical protein
VGGVAMKSGRLRVGLTETVVDGDASAFGSAAASIPAAGAFDWAE